MREKKIVIYPIAARANELRVVVATIGFRSDAPAEPRFHVNKRDVTDCFSQVRPFEPIGGYPLHYGTFTAVYSCDFSSTMLPAGSLRTKIEGVKSNRIGARPVPDSIPQDGLRLLIGSCHYRKRDEGRIESSLKGVLREDSKPHVNFLLGDQIYIDAPWYQNWDNSGIEILNHRWKSRYSKNFLTKSQLLSITGLAPTGFVPDDHEYWNNFPHRTAVTEWRPRGKHRMKEWYETLRGLYRSFQHPDIDDPGEKPVIIEIPPVSFFLLDTRTFRGGPDDPPDPKFDRLVHANVLKTFSSWSDRVIEKRLFPVIATAQPLLKKGKSDGFWSFLPGRFSERNSHAHMRDYDQFEDISAIVHKFLHQGIDVLWLAGDVHWGRVAKTVGKSRLSNPAAVYEVISSPLALVEGSPRGNPDDPERDNETFRIGKENYGVSVLDRCRGDQFALLEFAPCNEKKVEVSVRFVSVNAARPRIHPVCSFQLKQY